MSNKTVTTTAICFLIIAGIASGADIYVPDDYATIQDAIAASANGDTVIVRPGTYMENVDFLGRAITVRSEMGPGLTLIDANQSGRSVTFQSGENANSLLEGFTLTGGDTTTGGGILCDASSPTIRGNIIVGNSVNYWPFGFGGGICCSNNSAPLITNNIISENSATAFGGGIYCGHSSPTIINNTILDNLGTHYGGGIYCYLSSPLITNNTILGNSANSSGGGLYCLESSPMVTNTIIRENNSPAGPEIHLAGPNQPTITFCNVKGGWTGTGNIDADPAFVEPSVDDYHLTFDSPCKDAGNISAPGLPLLDFEGDPRASDSSVDIGADEFHPHFYYSVYIPPGGVVPGALGAVKVIGYPGQPFTVGQGSGIQDPPQSTPFGDLYLSFPIRPIMSGFVPPNGAAIVLQKAPDLWEPGEHYFYQALAGGKLTNPVVVVVE